MNKYERNMFGLVKTITLLLLLCSSTVFAQTQQEHVHHMAHGVMPFEMSKTIHIFKMTESGGVQRFIVRDPGDTDQITARFSTG
jgi:hypothetical protein